MAVPIRLSNVPDYLRDPQLADYHDVSPTNKQNGLQELLQFPKSTCVLWDGTSTGPPVFLHIAQNRKPRLRLWEKVLWLTHRQAGSDGSANRVLVGSMSVDDDAEGVCFDIDGLDTRQAGSDSSLVLGDVMIPVQVFNSRNEDRTGSVEDYAGAMKMLEKRCGGRDAVDLNSFMLLKGWCSFYSNHTSHKTVAHLQFDLVTLATVLKATPVHPVPIVPTALAKNLGGPRSLSHMQGRPKLGYLTMDHTRKLLLVLESDPKVSSLPIVGIWVSGVSVVHHPFVWASCLRYLRNEQLQDRVCLPPEGFLLVLYTPLHSKPEFYEVATTSGKPDLEFDLYTGYEITSVNKTLSGQDPTSVEWELSPVRNGPKRELFDAALGGMKSAMQQKPVRTASPAPSSSDDIMPRMTPAPHCAKTMTVKHMVPEVSMIWNDSSPSPGFQPPPFSSAPSQLQPNLNPAANSSSYPASIANQQNRAANSVPFPALSSSSRPAHLNYAHTTATSSQVPVSAQRYMAGSVPCAVNGNPAARTVHSVAHASDALVSSSGHPASDSVPRYQHAQMAQGQSNNNAGSFQPGASSAMGFQAAPYTTSIPQSQLPYVTSASQPVNGFNPPHVQQPLVSGYQSHAPAAMQHPPRMAFGSGPHPNYQPYPQAPQPQPYSQPIQSQPSSAHPAGSQFPHPPRLLAPTAMHYCQANQESARPEGSGSMAHPSMGGVHGHHNNGSMPPPPPPQWGPPSTLAGHPQTYSRQPAPWPHQPASYGPGPVGSVQHCAATGQARPRAPCSAPGPTGHPQGINSHAQGAELSQQRHSGSPVHRQEGYGLSASQQQPQDPARGCPSSLPSSHPPPPPSKPSSSHFYAQAPSSGGYSQGGPGAVGAVQPAGTVPGIQQVANNSGSNPADSTSCSGKSSDDSGLSVTPDRSNPSPKPGAYPAGVEGEAGVGVGSGGLQGVDWAGVPPQVVQLLFQQDAQLKVLTTQIQLLLAQQGPASAPSSTTPTSSTSLPSSVSAPSSPPPPPALRETRSTAVNTTLTPQGGAEAGHCVSVQTSPPRHHAPSPPHAAQLTPQQSPLLPPASFQAHSASQRLGGGGGSPLGPAAEMHLQRMHSPHSLTPAAHRAEAASAGQTPSELRHLGAALMSSTQCHEGSVPAAGSFHSSVGLEPVSPARSAEYQAHNSHSTPSPLSASMCAHSKQGEGEPSGEEVSPDSKEYYDQLINNIRLFLNSHSQDAEGSEANKGDSLPPDMTCTRLDLLDSALAASPSLHLTPSVGGGGGSSSSNTTMMPHINYLSLMLNSESETSLEINSMAMKYLRDEQLTQLARLHHHPQPAPPPSSSSSSSSSKQLLRQVLAASLDATGASSDVSRAGMSATNMSMATRRYMEKHGLLGGGEEDSVLDTNHTLRLQTDFSLALMSEESPGGSSYSPAPSSSSPQKALNHNSSPSCRSPVKREVLQPSFRPSPAIVEEGNSYGERSGGLMGDLGASPALQPPLARRHQYRDASPEDTPMFPERFHCARGGQNLGNDCSVATEDDRILDIEKLKQMPKLL